MLYFTASSSPLSLSCCFFPSNLDNFPPSISSLPSSLDGQKIVSTKTR